MSEERDKVRCRQCELVQWNDGEHCRRCGVALPQPVIKIVERVIEKVVVRLDTECVRDLEQARRIIAEVSDRLARSSRDKATPFLLAGNSELEEFPTMAEVERAMILAAYQRSNRKTLDAARLLGIGKTTLYRKLRELQQAA